MRTRWITVGEVESGWYVQVPGQAGYPQGFWMYWRGEVGFAQPCEFLELSGLEWAVRRRLELAGLELVEWVLTPSPIWLELRCVRARVGRKRDAVRRVNFRRRASGGVGSECYDNASKELCGLCVLGAVEAVEAGIPDGGLPEAGAEGF